MDENKSEVNSLNKTEIFRYAIVFFFAVDVVPAVVGIPLMVAFQTSIYMEVFYIVFGVIALLAVLFRSRRRDSKNYKNNKTIFEDKTIFLFSIVCISSHLYIIKMGLFHVLHIIHNNLPIQKDYLF